MKIVKSLLLGTAALVAGSFSAQAADLAAAEPVEYVRICDAYGRGYFFIPGSSDTCLRISGYVRAYFAYQARNQNQSSTGFGNGAGDTINPVVVNATGLNGVALTGNAGILASGSNAVNYANYGPVGNQIAADLAAVTAGNAAGATAAQVTAGTAALARITAFGPNYVLSANAETSDQYVSGIRALLRFDARTKTEFGILRSFFEFAADSSNAARNGTALQVRYGFVQFGPLTAGVTDSFFNNELTNAFLSPFGDRSQRLPVLAYTASFGNGVSVTFSAEEAGVTGGAGGSSSNLINGGAGGAWVRRSVQLPDFVANARVAQSWGSAQVSAAVGQNRFANTACTTGFAVGGVCTANQVGWAVSGGVKINLPAIAKGDSFYINGVYAEGALSYLGNVTSQSYFGNGAAGNNGNVTSRSGWAVVAEFNHFFTPAIRAAIIGGYTRLDSNPAANFGANVVYLREAWNIYGQLFWTPIRGFDIGVEVFYQDLTYNAFGNGALLGNRILGSVNDAGWGGYFRVQRSF